MLFNSLEFIFLFLPVALLGYLGLRKLSGQTHIYVWLTITSLVFYSWWDSTMSWLILSSILVNFGIGRALKNTNHSRMLLIFGIVANLAPLTYYKYSGFLYENFMAILGDSTPIESYILPLGISFFTFQQITYLIDAYKGEAKDYKFFHYATFVTFFPQLIAGPIVHHSEIMPQFDQKRSTFNKLLENIAIGISIFTVGLFKKVVIADNLALLASPVFQTSLTDPIEFFTAWTGALAYTFQLYFDFSGYSDMAIGLARMFGIILPANFFSPYKATSIIDFWRRWHITLSRFLKEYIYIPLGGNRKGNVRRQTNLMVTMLIGGIWHGAGWPFILWGIIHGIYLVTNHLWIKAKGQWSKKKQPYSNVIGGVITFLAVTVAWVFFKAETLSSAIHILKGMTLLNGMEIPKALFPFNIDLSHIINFQTVIGGGHAFAWTWLQIFIAASICLFGRNTIEIFSDYKPILETALLEKIPPLLRFRPSLAWSFFISVLFYASLCQMLGEKSSEFLYFNF